jgi:hypothetical protein
VPATAGTDVFLNRIGSNLPGGDRVYVHVDGPLSYGGWIDGLKAGKSFVTSGPMLTFTANGEEPGTVLKLGEKPRISVKATARSRFPLPAGEGGTGPQREGTRDREARRRRADGNAGSGSHAGRRGLAGVPRRRARDR